MSRQEYLARRLAGKREQVLEAATGAFARDGYDRASMEEIARAADVSTATLYKLYPSKLSLFEAVIRRGVAAFEVRFTVAGTMEPDRRLDQVARDYAGLLMDPVTAGNLRAVITAAAATPQVAWVFYEAAKSAVAGAFLAAVHSCRDDGLLTVDDAPEAAAHLMGMIEHATLWGPLLTGVPSTRTAEDIAASATRALRRAYAPG